MRQFQKPRGTTDWYGKNIEKFSEIVNKLSNLAKNFNFSEINPPTFESIELFKKSIGEETDISQKELYTIVDRKNRILALRPEGTSSVIRAYVENKMFANKTNTTKLFYILNLFRYERPQSGRLREFHQFGIEYLNVTNHLVDIECLLFAYDIIKLFKLEKYITLKINYLGNIEQRRFWIEDLKKYFSNYKNDLTQDSLNRLDTNPLRILDDKVDGVKSFVKNAPKLDKYLTSEDKQIFSDVLSAIKSNGINYLVDDSLVRGLDYYTGIVFEFVYENNSAPLTIIGGGRYSNLIMQTGGPDQIGLGFGLGIERLINALKETNYPFENYNKIEVLLGASNYENSLIALKLANNLRQNNINVEILLGNYKRDKNAHFAIKNNTNFFAFIDNDYGDSKKIMFENLLTNERNYLTIDEIKQKFIK